MIDFNNYKIVKLLDVATVERAIKGKIYNAGSVKCQISATRGQIEFMEEAGEVQSQFAVIKPTIEINRRYFFTSIENQYPKFFARYKTGLNISVDTFKHLEIYIHNRETQEYIAKAMELHEKELKKEEEIIQKYKDMKTYYLGKLFI